MPFYLEHIHMKTMELSAETDARARRFPFVSVTEVVRPYLRVTDYSSGYPFSKAPGWQVSSSLYLAWCPSTQVGHLPRRCIGIQSAASASEHAPRMLSKVVLLIIGALLGSASAASGCYNADGTHQCDCTTTEAACTGMWISCTSCAATGATDATDANGASRLTPARAHLH